MKDREKIIKAYIRKVKRCFPAYGKYEREYLSRLKGNLMEFAERTEPFHEEDIINEFGQPTDVAADYFSGVDEGYLRKRLRYAHFVRAVCVAAVAAILFFNILVSYMSYRDYKDALKYQDQLEDTIIEPGEEWYDWF